MQLQLSTLIAIISALETLARPVLDHSASHQQEGSHFNALETRPTEHDLVGTGSSSLHVASQAHHVKRSSNNQGKFHCGWCGATFTTQEACTNHEWTCGLAGANGRKTKKAKKGKRSSDLISTDARSLQATGQTHNAKRSSSNQITCTWCGATFKTAAARDAHEFTCGIGGANGRKKSKKGKRSNALEWHEHSHAHAEHDLVDAGPSSLQVSSHTHRMKRSSSNQITCAWCGATFKTVAARDAHQFTCGMNGANGHKKAKKGKRSSDFERRDDSHVQEKRFSSYDCAQCDELD